MSKGVVEQPAHEVALDLRLRHLRTTSVSEVAIGHILEVLLKHGVDVTDCGDDFYELVDIDGDPEVLYIPNPVLSETETHIYRRVRDLPSE